MEGFSVPADVRLRHARGTDGHRKWPMEGFNVPADVRLRGTLRVTAACSWGIAPANWRYKGILEAITCFGAALTSFSIGADAVQGLVRLAPLSDIAGGLE